MSTKGEQRFLGQAQLFIMTTGKTITVPDWHKIGEYARGQRKTAKMSLRAMAKVIGVSAPYLSDVERGNRSITAVNLAKIIEETFNRSPLAKAKIK